MRIAVPVEENEKEICPSFGRTPLFYIFDTETNSGTLIENDAMNAPGGAGIKAAQTVIDAKAEVVLVPRCGENAATIKVTPKIVSGRVVKISNLRSLPAISKKT